MRSARSQNDSPKMSKVKPVFGECPPINPFVVTLREISMGRDSKYSASSKFIEAVLCQVDSTFFQVDSTGEMMTIKPLLLLQLIADQANISLEEKMREASAVGLPVDEYAFGKSGYHEVIDS